MHLSSRVFLRHRALYGITDAEWEIFADLIDAMTAKCDEYGLRYIGIELE